MASKHAVVVGALQDAAARHDFTWSALRPEAVCGFAVGNPMNLAMAIAVYAVICAELGVPSPSPAGQRHGRRCSR